MKTPLVNMGSLSKTQTTRLNNLINPNYKVKKDWLIQINPITLKVKIIVRKVGKKEAIQAIRPIKQLITIMLET